MKLVTFTHNNKTRVGAVVDEAVVDSRADSTLPATMTSKPSLTNNSAAI